MPSDGPTIYINNRPFTPTERIEGFKPGVGAARAGRKGCRTKVVDRVTISTAAREMYRMIYGEGRSCPGTFQPARPPVCYSQSCAVRPLWE